MGAAVGMCPVYALLHERGHSASVGIDIDTDRDPDLSGPVLSPEDLRDRLNELLAAVADAVDCHFVRVRPDGGSHVEVRTHADFAYAISPTATRLATVAAGPYALIPRVLPGEAQLVVYIVAAAIVSAAFGALVAVAFREPEGGGSAPTS